MARSISSSISTLRSSLSDIRTAFSNVNVSVPSSLKVSQVDEYINQIDAKYPAYNMDLTGEEFKTCVSKVCDITKVKRIIFDPYGKKIAHYYSLYVLDTGKDTDYLDYNLSSQQDVLSICYRFGYPSRLKITDAKGMFEGFTNLKTVDLTHFDFSENTRMWNMFAGCKSLEYINFNGHDLSKVTDFDHMFDGCSNLEYVCFDAGGKYIPKPTYMTEMFYNCTSLKTVIIPINFNGLSSCNNIFYGCSNLNYIGVSPDYANWSDSSTVTEASAIFSGCTSLPGYSSSKISGKYANCSSSGYFYKLNY